MVDRISVLSMCDVTHSACRYSLSHAIAAVFNNPDLIAACVVGDAEAETDPLGTGWQSHCFLDPPTDGAAISIHRFNGYKISNPAMLTRIEHQQLEQFFLGCCWKLHFC